MGRLVAGVLEVAEETLGLLLEVPPWELELADEVPCEEVPSEEVSLVPVMASLRDVSVVEGCPVEPESGVPVEELFPERIEAEEVELVVPQAQSVTPANRVTTYLINLFFIGIYSFCVLV